jgi:hypothetical protein
MRRHLSTHHKMTSRRFSFPLPPALEPVSHWARSWQSDTNSSSFQPPSFVQGSSLEQPSSLAALHYEHSSAYYGVIFSQSRSEEWSDATANNHASVAANIAESPQLLDNRSPTRIPLSPSADEHAIERPAAEYFL